MDEPMEPIDPREEARIRRRDHDLDAERRNLMRPGMGKVFKQIQESWAKPPAQARKHARKTSTDRG